MAASPPLLIVVIGVLGGALAVATTMGSGRIPTPLIQDEFSYLLSADTFAHWRLTNPTHPFWEHFETFHVLQSPTYASKYPPAQGLALAIGQILTGHPIVGVWLSYAAMCAAVTWMLAGWMPPKWACWGGVFMALLVVGVNSDGAYWVRSYWGGAVAATGGALVFGGARRIINEARVLPALALAAGVGLLANSRPYEGLLVVVPVAMGLVIWLARTGGPSGRRKVTHVVLPIAAALTTIAAMMGWYNYRVTGDAATFPHTVYEDTYGFTPTFVWQTPGPLPDYRHAEMHAFYVTMDQRHPRATSMSGFVDQGARRLLGTLDFYFPVFAIVLLVMALRVARETWIPVVLTSIAMVCVGSTVVPWSYPHYVAPALGPIAIVLTGGARHLNDVTTPWTRIGPLLVRLVLVLAIGSAAVQAVAPFVTRDALRGSWSSQRSEVERSLRARDGKDLVFVLYGPRHNVHAEWVHNGADLTGAEVVWARSLGPERDAALVEFYADRTSWVLFVDDSATPPELRQIVSATP